MGSMGGYIACVIASIALGFLCEAVSFLRAYLSKNKGMSRGVRRGLIQVTYAFQMLLAYILMLIAMTFNVMLFFGVIIGLTIGYAASVSLDVMKVFTPKGDEYMMMHDQNGNEIVKDKRVSQI